VKLTGTIRSLTARGMAFLEERVRAIATHIAAANRCDAQVDFLDAYPPTVNDAHCWDVAQSVARDMLGESNIQQLLPVMGGEDFSYYTNRIPGCFVALGMRNEREGSVYGVHHPMFKADEDILPVGSALHVAYAMKTLNELKK
jgi:IAA-amino acid hydrolase